jgi:hypothetical protein
MSKKFEKNLIVAVPESLFKDFKGICEERYTTMSQEIRNFMLQYVEGYRNEKKNND